MSRRKKVTAGTVFLVLLVGGLVLIGLALMAGKPKLALGIAIVDPVIPP